VVSSALVTLKLGKDMSAIDFKVRILNAGAWTASTKTISSLSLTNFAVSVQTQAASLTLTIPATSLSGTTVALNRTYDYTM
jgi:hypothetical protein